MAKAPQKIEEPGTEDHDVEGGESYRFTTKAVQNARWMRDVEIKEGEKERVPTEILKGKDKVKLVVDALGYPSSTEATFTIFEKKKDGEEQVTEVKGSSKENEAEAEWEYEMDEESDHETAEGGETGYSIPRYYFKVKVEDKEAKSGFIKLEMPPEFVPSL